MLDRPWPTPPPPSAPGSLFVSLVILLTRWLTGWRLGGRPANPGATRTTGTGVWKERFGELETNSPKWSGSLEFAREILVVVKRVLWWCYLWYSVSQSHPFKANKRFSCKTAAKIIEQWGSLTCLKWRCRGFPFLHCCRRPTPYRC